MTTLPIGRVIREFRELRGISRNHLDKISRLGDGYIKRIEDHHQSPSIERLERIAKALRIEMWELVKQAQMLQKRPDLYDYESKNPDQLANLPATTVPAISDAEVA